MTWNPDMEPCEIIAEAKELISDKYRWYQGALHNDQQTKFCALGAVAKVCGIEGYDYPDKHDPETLETEYMYPNAAEVAQWLNTAAQDMYSASSIVDLNDLDSEDESDHYNEQIHAQVVECFNKAINDHCS